MERKRFQILFYLRKDRKDKKGFEPIYLRVSLDKKSASLTISRKAKPSQWNASKGYVKTNHPEHQEINDFIDLMRSKVRDAQQRLMEKGDSVDPHNIIRVLRGEYEKQYTLLEVFELHNENMRKGIGKGNTEGSFKNYRLTYRHIKKFLRRYYKRNDIELSKVDHKFLTDFDYYLRIDCKNANNGSMKNFVRLKKIIRIALSNEWLMKDPFWHFKIRIESFDRVFLNKDELRLVETKKMPTAKLETIRDIFTFMCYTGM